MIRLILCMLVSLLLTSAARAQVSVVATIRPLQLIAEAIVGDRGTVSSIIDVQNSPHQFSLLPSHRFALEAADLSLWIGPQFETYLADFFERQAIDKTVITALELAELTIHSVGADQIDAHIWLNTANALIIARQIANLLAALDEANAERYDQNLSAFEQAIRQADTEISAVFAEPATSSYAVYHNGYQYFEQQYGLNHAVVLVDDPEIQPGMQQLLRVRKQIQDSSPRCLILERDSNLELVQTIIRNQELRTVTIDLLGYEVVQGKDGYVKLIKRVAEDFASCLY
jgi:zinc transport system substrate-binding protein